MSESGRQRSTKTSRRWFHPAPGHIGIGLLMLQGLLLVSERFRWFRFNEQPGLTVLVTVAAAGLAILVMLFWFLASLSFRWRFQFSIQSLIALVVAVAVACSWLATELRRAKRQAQA